MRTMLLRSEHCHRMSIAGLSKCISQQQQIIEQNAIAMAELSAKFEKDAPFVNETLAKYLNDKEPPSAALQGEIAPGLNVQREPLIKGADGHYYLDIECCEPDLDDLP